MARALIFTCIGALAVTGVSAAQPRPSATVARVIVDPALSNVVPTEFTSILRRELELSLSTTGLFTVPTRDAAELDRVLDEIARTGGGGGGAARVDTIIAPTILSYELNERRRPAPYQANRDVITVSGALTMQITVMNASSAAVQARFPLEASYRDDGRIVDPNAPLGTNQAHANAYIQLARQAGRALAEYIRARNPAPDRMAAAEAGIVVVERQDQRVWLSPPAGLAVGTELQIFSAGGREIRHPTTHEVLGHIDQAVGRVRVVELTPQLALAEIVESSGDIAIGASARR